MPLIDRNFTLTRNAIKWIAKNYPQCIKIYTDDSTVELIESHLRMNMEWPYTTLIMTYGILFVLALIEYFIEIEDYERCGRLLKSIDLMNKRHPEYKLPVRLDDKWCIENMHRSPSAILNEIIKSRKI